MKYEMFVETLNAIRPDSGQAAEIWFEWAKELEGFDKGGEPEKAGKPAEEFLDEFVSHFCAAQERHGNDVAGQMVALSEIGSCIFPWEMQRAAEHLAEGGNIHDIIPMSMDGVLEGPTDSGQGSVPAQSM